MPDPLDLTSAPAYAASVGSRTELRWRALELAALHGHPDIQWYLDRDSHLGAFPEPRGSNAPRSAQRQRRDARRERWNSGSGGVRRLRFVGLSATVILGLFGLLLPALIPIIAFADIWAGILVTAGFASRLDGPVIDPDVSIPTSGVLMLLVAVALPTLQLLEKRLRRRRDPDILLLLPQSYLSAMVCGPGAALGVLILGRKYDVAQWQISALACLLGGVVGLVCELRRSRDVHSDHHTDHDVNASGSTPAEPLLPEHLAGRYDHLKPALRLIRALGADQRAAARGELAIALSDLTARGILTSEESARAGAAGVGLLAAEMPNLRRERA